MPRPIGNSARRWGLRLAKWTLLVVVLLFVGLRGWQLWQDSPPIDVDVAPAWLVAAALAYLAGWIPSVVFWQQMLAGLGEPVPWWAAVRAYYCGHLGKYIPGKAMVLVIRGGVVKSSGGRMGPAALTAAYETLTTMGAAVAMGAALFPLIGTNDQWQRLPGWAALFHSRLWLMPLLVTVVTLAALPLIARLYSWAAAKMVRPASDDLAPGEPPHVPRIATSTLAIGLAIVSLGWVCHGLSLVCVLRGISPDVPTWTTAVACLVAVCVATVAGFLAIFAPGGVGVREGLLIEILSAQPEIEPGIAVLAAVLLRVVWFASEVAAAAALTIFRGKADLPTAKEAP